MSNNREDEKETPEIYEKAADLVDSWSGEDGIGEREIMDAFEQVNDEEREKWLKICVQLIGMPSRRARILLSTLSSKYGVKIPAEIQEQTSSYCPEK